MNEKINEKLKTWDKRELTFGSMLAMNNRIQAVGDRFYKEITFKQFFLFACMGVFRPDAPTINELADLMGCSHQNVKVIATKLAERGFIEFKTDPEDKRKQRLYFTDYYYEVAVPYGEKEDAFINHLFQGITPENLKTYLAVLKQLEQNLQCISEEIK